MVFVERVGGDADRGEECQDSREQPDAVDVRCERRSDDDVGKMPCRVGRVEQRPPVSPATGSGAVVRGPVLGLRHGTSSPTSRVRHPGSSRGFRRRSCRRRPTPGPSTRAGTAGSALEMFGPRKRPTAIQLRPPTAAGGGEHEPRVEPPRPAPERVAGYQEVEARHRRARLEYTSEFPQRGGRLGDVAQEIGERDARRTLRRGRAAPRRARRAARCEPSAALAATLAWPRRSMASVRSRPATNASVRSVSWSATPAVPVATSSTRARARPVPSDRPSPVATGGSVPSESTSASRS